MITYGSISFVGRRNYEQPKTSLAVELFKLEDNLEKHRAITRVVSKSSVEIGRRLPAVDGVNFRKSFLEAE